VQAESYFRVSTGIMVEGVAVRDLLPRAPARLSKKIHIGDIILAIDGQAADAQNVLTLLRGSDAGASDTDMYTHTACLVCSRLARAVYLMSRVTDERFHLFPGAVGSKITLDLQKKDGSRVQVALTRISTQKVFDIKVLLLTPLRYTSLPPQIQHSARPATLCCSCIPRLFSETCHRDWSGLATVFSFLYHSSICSRPGSQD